jgi:uncharacterized protein
MDENCPLVIYHAECSDGFCSAWIAKLAMPNTETYSAFHNQDPPDVSGKDVFLLDFAYRREILEQMKSKSRSLLILDHHKTAQKDLQGLWYCIFDLDHSGAGLAWNYFKRKIGGLKPWIVEYVEDRDLERWLLPFSHEINAALDTYPFDFNVWTELVKMPKKQTLDKMINEGKPIVKYQERLVDRIVKSARPVKICSHSVLAANTTTQMGETALRLAQGKSFGVSWFQRADGQYVYSLRSIGNCDVSKIAEHFKGGGHTRSAGFETTKLIF